MKKSILLLLIVHFCCIVAFGQQKISTEITDAHKNVVGTKVSLIPPKEFTKAVNFLGFQQTKTGSSIMVLNVPADFSEVSAGFTKEGLLTQGVIASKIERITLNDLPALFVTAEQKAYGITYTKYILTFGSNTETMLINGIFPKSLTALNDGMKKALLSTVYDASKKIDPFKNVDFKIDTTGTGLMFANYVGSSMIFNRDGKMPSQSKDKASVIISKSFSTGTVDDKKLFAINRIKNLPIEIDAILSTKPIKIDSIFGYEIIADAKDKKTGVKEKVYQVLLFTDSIYYMLFGSSEADFDANILLFQKFIKTFERKE